MAHYLSLKKRYSLKIGEIQSTTSLQKQTGYTEMDIFNNN